MDRWLMWIHVSGFRWLHETWLQVDRGVEFYNTATMDFDAAFLASRAAWAALGIGAEDKYVWPSARGNVRGAAIPPLYDGATELTERAPELYEALTLVDALRVGRARKRELAREKREAWVGRPGDPS